MNSRHIGVGGEIMETGARSDYQHMVTVNLTRFKEQNLSLAELRTLLKQQSAQKVVLLEEIAELEALGIAITDLETPPEFNAETCWAGIAAAFAAKSAAKASGSGRRLSKIPRKLRPLVAVVALLAFLAIAACAVSAGLYFFKDEQNAAVYSGRPTETGMLDIKTPAANGHASLGEALKELLPSEKAPTWIPDGYALEQIQVVSEDGACDITAWYENSEDESGIVITVAAPGSKFSESITKATEKDKGEQTYTDSVSGTVYHCYTNGALEIANWEGAMSIWTISAPITRDELLHVLESINEGELE